MTVPSGPLSLSALVAYTSPAQTVNVVCCGLHHTLLGEQGASLWGLWALGCLLASHGGAGALMSSKSSSLRTWQHCRCTWSKHLGE